MFEITIKEITRERQLVGQEWKLTGMQNDAVYGYTPDIEREVDVTRDILKQTVKDLDLAAVIKAINNI